MITFGNIHCLSRPVFEIDGASEVHSAPVFIALVSQFYFVFVSCDNSQELREPFEY